MSLDSLKDELKTGVGSLDFEHRTLVGLMEALCERYDENTPSSGPSQPVSDAFGALYAGVSAHFALEERLMRENEFPSYADHKADHEKLLDRIRAMMEAYEGGMCADCGTTLRACLEAWIAGHVAGPDAELRKLAE